MIASMTLAEIQAKYADVHTPEEVAQYQENMTNSQKWRAQSVMVRSRVILAV